MSTLIASVHADFWLVCCRLKHDRIRVQFDGCVYSRTTRVCHPLWPLCLFSSGMFVAGLNYDRNIVQFYGVCVPKDTSEPPMLICELLKGDYIVLEIMMCGTIHHAP